MKAISPLALGAVLLVTGIAFAQTPAQKNSEGSPSPAATNSSANGSDVTQSNAAANNASSKATNQNGATPQSASSACKKQASDKKLSGDDKTKFMSDCKQGKTTGT
jgi:hypothetical protein